MELAVGSGDLACSGSLCGKPSSDTTWPFPPPHMARPQLALNTSVLDSERNNLMTDIHPYKHLQRLMKILF